MSGEERPPLQMVHWENGEAIVVVAKVEESLDSCKVAAAEE